MKYKRKKICLISSSGGHFEQLLMLKNLDKTFDTYMVTEKTKYNQKSGGLVFLMQINRQEKAFFFKFIFVCLKSLYIFIVNKPDIIISTGALSCIPTLIIGKIFNKKIIYIESFAKTKSPTKTGKLIYKYADIFIVQWEDLREVYPKAIYLGSIY